MTREEEIDKAGLEWFSQVKKYDADAATAFLAGAQWADEHPKRITYEELEDVAKEVIDKDWQEQQDKYWAMIKGNLERSLRAKFTLKACKWIERNYHATPNGGYYYLPEDCIEQFKQAMKGEQI